MASDDNFFGLFQQFRPFGEGVERVFAGIPRAEQYVERLLGVYQATSHAEWAQDMYFVVRHPVATTMNELQNLCSSLVAGIRELAAVIGNRKLAHYLGQPFAIEVVSKAVLGPENDYDILVTEGVGDWVTIDVFGDASDPVAKMGEALYSVACDEFLAYYLQWPYLERWCPRDVFRPYFELWRRGAEVSFEHASLRLGIDVLYG